MTGTARLFFALWPEARVRGELNELGGKLHMACGGRQMRAENLHLTLVFLGNVAVSRIDALRSVAERVAYIPFSVTLNHLGWWRHNRVAWAAPQATPEPLQALVKRLQAGLSDANFTFDDRPVFAPHVSLLRNARCEQVEMPPMQPIVWAADGFVLVKSVTTDAGVTYEVIGRWDAVSTA